MNEITSWNYEGAEVRTVQIDGEPWFVLADICRELEISHVKDTATRIDEDDLGQTEVIDRMGRSQTATIINESGLYNVIIRSDKAEAIPFRRWVTHEVLPSIQARGIYDTGDAGKGIVQPGHDHPDRHGAQAGAGQKQGAQNHQLPAFRTEPDHGAQSRIFRRPCGSEPADGYPGNRERAGLPAK
mgnify:CR=1 FL=1